MVLNTFFRRFLKKWKNIIQKENLIKNSTFEWIQIDNMSNYMDNNKFTSTIIKDYIYKTYKYVCKISWTNKSINNLYYFSEKPFQINIHSKLKVKSTKNIVNMMTIISSLKKMFHREEFGQDVYYFPTPFKKELPKPDEMIGVHECNSGATFLYYPSNLNDSNGKIILFREEEHIKVLIHELIHSNYCDEKLVSEQEGGNKTCFCSKYPVLFHETYTETFATVLNIFFIGIMKGKSSEEIEKMIKNERLYSSQLSRRIFDFYNIDEITQVMKNNNNKCSLFFPQQSNVLSYYILKPLLLSHFKQYAVMMAKYTNDGVIIKNGIYDYFQSMVLSFIDDMEKTNKNFSDNNKINSLKNINKKSLRMTYNDINK